MRALSLTLTLLVGCDGGNKDTAAEDLFSCEETIDDLSLEEASPLGFAGRNVTALTSGAQDALLTWSDGSTTTLTLTPTYVDGGVRFVDREVKTEGTGGEVYDTAYVEEMCPDSLEVDMELGFWTEDGAFEETWETVFYAYDAETIRFYHDLDPEDLSGGFDLTAFVTSTDYDELSASVSGIFTASGSEGQLSGQASGEEECEGDECTAWAEQIEIGTWETEE